MPDADVVGLLHQLPERFVGDPTGRFRARFRIDVDGVRRDVVVSPSRCRVEPTRGHPDTEIIMSAATWRALESGRLSGIEAFARRKVAVRGSIEAALHFEPLFERPDNGALRYSMEKIGIPGAGISALVAGAADLPPLFLIHGLGATKSSWLPILPALAERFRVVALDLPGFGASSKPMGRYDAPWFARHVFALMDELGFERSFVAGNSMGGRIAMEMAMTRPDRLSAIACLCPAAAFSHRPALAFVRIARPELGLVPTLIPRRIIRDGLKQLFAQPGRIEGSWFEAAIDDFLAVWRSPRARLAFFASARNIYLDEPYGDTGFWSRLVSMDTPSLFIYGGRDVLITSRFGSIVQDVLPAAKVVVWKDVGHVPQLEAPVKTTRAILDFFATANVPIDGSTARVATL